MIYFGEFLLQETAKKISSDAFIQSRVASPFLNRDAIRQKIRQVFLPGYFNKYDVEIFLFGASGESLDSSSTMSFPELVKTNPDAQRTDFSEVYFVNDPNGMIGQQYMVVMPVRAIWNHIGLHRARLRVEARDSGKRVSRTCSSTTGLSRSIAHRILATRCSRRERFFIVPAIITTSSNLIQRGSLIRNYISEGISREGFDHIADEDENGRMAVVTSPVVSGTSVLGNFSFLMVCGLTVILIFILIQGSGELPARG